MAGSPKKRAKRGGAAAAADPLDETYAAPRAALAAIPWNKQALTEQGREAVAQALLDGYPRNQIARALGTTVKTLKRLIDGEPMLLDAIEARKDAEEADLCDALKANARNGDSAAAMFLLKARHGYRDRDDAKGQVIQGGGVLVVPATVPLDEWSVAAARQQAKFRETPADVLHQRAEREAQVRRDSAVHTGSPGIEGLRLVKLGA